MSLLFNPTLKNLPVAVCGDKQNRHGIILAKNEHAKKYGVKTAEAIFEAQRKCPDLILLPPIYDKYSEYSKKAAGIYRKYTDMIEPFGIDECWLDVTGSTVIFGNGEEIALKIKEDIKRELGITASVGVSFNKIFAKLGSDMKKPDAVTVISRENFKDKVWSLPAESLLFVGSKTCEKLKSFGIHTIKDLTCCDDATLRKLLGKNGVQLKQYALGNDVSPVTTPADSDKPKSVGRSATGAADFAENTQVWKAFLAFCENICETLREKDLYASGVQVHIRTKALKVYEFSRSFPASTNCAITLAKWGFELFCQNYSFGEPLRSVGIRAINLKNSDCADQLDMFGDSEKERQLEKVEDSIYSVRKKYGRQCIKRGTNI